MGELNGNGMGMRLGSTGANIYSGCFDGLPVKESVRLPDGPSKCVLYSVPVSFGFATHSRFLKEQATASDFVYNPLIINGIALYRSGSSNPMAFSVKDIQKWGPAYHPEDREFEQWKRAGEWDQTVRYSTPEKEGGLVIGPQKKAYFHPSMTELPTKYITSIIAHEGPNNSFGKWISRVANVEQDFRNLMFDDTHRHRFNPEITSYFDYLNSIGYDNPRELVGIGSEVMKKGIGAAHYHNGTSIITASSKIYEEAKKIAEAHGLKGPEAVKFVKEYIYFHELYHLFDREHSSIADKETRVGEGLYEFFKDRSRLLKGSKLERIYRALAREAKSYAEGWSKAKSLSFSKLESLISKYKAEAEEFGIEDVEEYVSGKLEEELEKVESDDKKSGLEGKLKENIEKSEKEETNPDEGQETYEGKEEVEKENYEGKEVEEGDQDNHESNEADTKAQDSAEAPE